MSQPSIRTNTDKSNESKQNRDLIAPHHHTHMDQVMDGGPPNPLRVVPPRVFCTIVATRPKWKKHNREVAGLEMLWSGYWTITYHRTLPSSFFIDYLLSFLLVCFGFFSYLLFFLRNTLFVRLTLLLIPSCLFFHMLSKFIFSFFMLFFYFFLLLMLLLRLI